MEARADVYTFILVSLSVILYGWIALTLTSENVKTSLIMIVGLFLALIYGVRIIHSKSTQLFLERNKIYTYLILIWITVISTLFTILN